MPSSVPKYGRVLSVEEINELDRESRAWEMRKAGYDLTTIAHALGLKSRMAAQRRITRRTKLLEPSLTEIQEVRVLELARLDELFREMWILAVGDGINTNLRDPDTGMKTGRNADGTYWIPSQRAVDRCLRIMERRAALLGLDLKGSRPDIDEEALKAKSPITEIIVEVPGSISEMRAQLLQPINRLTAPIRETRTDGLNRTDDIRDANGVGG